MILAGLWNAHLAAAALPFAVLVVAICIIESISKKIKGSLAFESSSFEVACCVRKVVFNALGPWNQHLNPIYQSNLQS